MLKATIKRVPDDTAWMNRYYPGNSGSSLGTTRFRLTVFASDYKAVVYPTHGFSTQRALKDILKEA